MSQKMKMAMPMLRQYGLFHSFSFNLEAKEKGPVPGWDIVDWVQQLAPRSSVLSLIVQRAIISI